MIEVSATSLLYNRLLLNITKTLTNVSCGDFYIYKFIIKYNYRKTSFSHKWFLFI